MQTTSRMAIFREKLSHRRASPEACLIAPLSQCLFGVARRAASEDLRMLVTMRRSSSKSLGGITIVAILKFLFPSLMIEFEQILAAATYWESRFQSEKSRADEYAAELARLRESNAVNLELLSRVSEDQSKIAGIVASVFSKLSQYVTVSPEHMARLIESVRREEQNQQSKTNGNQVDSVPLLQEADNGVRKDNSDGGVVPRPRRIKAARSQKLLRKGVAGPD